ncbi:T9SS type A sorting domain-containing protein [Neolewinella aurantiaca]|uniref:T9SS type A sorting domain-containing protein n=1 Tax=Neolewinella aurantiaca TaxID=2602767 RepID=A0A5C7FF21_9BACT|nr:HmuY family protein [Neolewinella aurantiaca]TXF84388.1 T9SS type A sorting domain-containing protein [Neolewinella aurantiaca]
MKSISTYLFLLLVLPYAVSAQFMQAEQGPGYATSVYFELATGNSTQVDHTAWDIAFNVGSRSLGILVNEGVSSSQAEPQRAVELYASSATDFTTADTSQITGRLYNGESSWDDGAFNAPAAPSDPFDLGWGTYDPTTHIVSGSRVFFLATRDGVYHKLFVEALAGSVYTFIHGPLDGSTTDTVMVDKAQFAGKTLAYFSFEDGLVDLEPENWDLLFTRYVTPLADGEGGILDYNVTGVLHNEGVSVAKLSGVDPATVAAPTDEEAYSDTLTTIGYEWKSFDLGTFQWAIPEDLVYFVQTPDSLYRLQFIDFEGSSTGVSTFGVNAENATATTSLPSGVNNSRLFPNPAPQETTLEIEVANAAEDLSLEVIDPTGRTLYASRVRALNVGLNQINIPLNNLPAGNYFVRVQGSIGVLTHHLIKQ